MISLAAVPVSIDVDAYLGSSGYVNPVKTSDDFELDGFMGLMATGASRRLSDTDMRTVHNMFSRWSASGINEGRVLDNFNRFYSVFPEMEMAADLKTYIFITRPEMNLLASSTSGVFGGGSSGTKTTHTTLVTENQKDVRLLYMAQYCPEILHMLTEDYSSTHDFIPYLQSRAMSLELPDYQIRTSDFTIPFFSYKFTYPTVTNESETGGSFNITFREDERLRITNMFQFWIYYQDAVTKNKMKVASKHKWENFFDYMCSVYELVCDPTSMRILFWSKYTGCFPTSVGISNLSHNLQSTVNNSVSVGFNYIRVEHNNPMIIADFHMNTAGAGSNFEPVYNDDFGVIGDSLVGCPKIIEDSVSKGLYLEWTPYVVGPSATAMADNANILSNAKNAYKNVQSFQDQTASELRANWREIISADDTAQIGRDITGGLRQAFDASLRGSGPLVNYLANNSDVRR